MKKHTPQVGEPRQPGERWCEMCCDWRGVIATGSELVANRDQASDTGIDRFADVRKRARRLMVDAHEWSDRIHHMDDAQLVSDLLVAFDAKDVQIRRQQEQIETLRSELRLTDDNLRNIWGDDDDLPTFDSVPALAKYVVARAEHAEAALLQLREAPRTHEWPQR